VLLWWHVSVYFLSFLWSVKDRRKGPRKNLRSCRRDQRSWLRLVNQWQLNHNQRNEPLSIRQELAFLFVKEIRQPAQKLQYRNHRSSSPQLDLRKQQRLGKEGRIDEFAPSIRVEIPTQVCLWEKKGWSKEWSFLPISPNTRNYRFSKNLVPE